MNDHVRRTVAAYGGAKIVVYLRSVANFCRMIRANKLNCVAFIDIRMIRYFHVLFVTGSIARSANLPVFSLLRGRF